MTRRTLVIAAAVALVVTGGAVALVVHARSETAPRTDTSRLGPTGALIDELLDLDRATNQRFKAIEPPRGDHTAAQHAADVVDMQLVPPILALHAKIAAATIPDDQRVAFEAARRHLDAEAQLFRDLAHNLRDPVWGAANLDRIKADRADAVATIQSLIAQLARLGVH